MIDKEFINNNLIFIKATVKKAAKKAVKKYSAKMNIKNKKNGTPVTSADLLIQEIITSEFEKFKIPFISEERPFKLLDSKFFWILDPIDGTDDFIKKTGEFSVMLGFLEKKKDGKFETKFGLVYWPAKDLLYYAAKKQGAFREDSRGKIERLRVSKKPLKNGIMLLSRSHGFEGEMAVARKLQVNSLLFLGSIGLKSALIAQGDAEVYLKSSSVVGLWDICAPKILIEEAGGIFHISKTNSITNFAVSNSTKNSRLIRKFFN